MLYHVCETQPYYDGCNFFQWKVLINSLFCLHVTFSAFYERYTCTLVSLLDAWVFFMDSHKNVLPFLECTWLAMMVRAAKLIKPMFSLENGVIMNLNMLKIQLVENCSFILTSDGLQTHAAWCIVLPYFLFYISGVLYMYWSLFLDNPHWGFGSPVTTLILGLQANRI